MFFLSVFLHFLGVSQFALSGNSAVPRSFGAVSAWFSQSFSNSRPAEWGGLLKSAFCPPAQVSESMIYRQKQIVLHRCSRYKHTAHVCNKIISKGTVRDLKTAVSAEIVTRFHRVRAVSCGGWFISAPPRRLTHANRSIRSPGEHS